MALSLIPDTEARTGAWDEVFFKANQAYKQEHFQEAIDGYNQLILSGHTTGSIYYNLGNAYYRQKQLGRAILNYERARLMIPRDADLNFNLRQARDQSKDAIPGSDDFVGMIFFWLDSLSLSELFWGFAALNLLFWGILLVRLFRRSDGTYYMLLLFFILWLIAGLSYGLKWYEVETDDRAVIVQDEAAVLAGPDIRDTVLFKLHAGTIVHHERSEDGWFLIHLPDKKRGWVRAEAAENIR